MTARETTSDSGSTSLIWMWSAIVAAVAAFIFLQIVLAKASSTSKESLRRWQHAITGQSMVAISYILPIPICIGALLVGSLAIYFSHKTSWYEQTFGSLLRPHEKQQLPGAFFFLLGALITTILFDLDKARYAILCLSFGDPMAAWVGRKFPTSPRFLSQNSSIIGSTACFMTSFLLGAMIFYSKEDFVWKAFAGASTCTVAEALPFVDDNLMIPISTAMSLHIFEKYFS